MNLRQAIEAGAEQVSGRCRHSFLRLKGGQYEACALGAAYLGCHPDANPVELVNRPSVFWKWIYEELPNAQTDVQDWPDTVMTLNDDYDRPIDESWDDLLTALDQRHEGLLDLEICNPGERTGSEPATSN